MKKQITDWQRARKLADFICSLGEFRHEIYKDGVEQHWGADGVQLYVDKGYVSCLIRENGKEKYNFTCFPDHMGLPDINKDTQNFADVVFPDMKKLDRAFRGALQSLVETAKERKISMKKEKIRALKDELKELKEAE